TEDESVRFVLPNHMLLVMTDRMPTDAVSVIGCCPQIPPLVRQNASDIAMLVQRTKLAVAVSVSSIPKTEKPMPEATHVRFEEEQVDTRAEISETIESSVEESPVSGLFGSLLGRASHQDDADMIRRRELAKQVMASLQLSVTIPSVRDSF